MCKCCKDQSRNHFKSCSTKNNSVVGYTLFQWSTLYILQ